MSGAADQALALLQLGRGSEAVPILSAALAERPDDSRLLRLMSWACRVCGRPGEALEHAKHAIRGDPVGASNYFQASLAYQDLGCGREAVILAEETVRFAPESWWAHARLSASMVAARQSPRRALAAAEKAVELAPDEAYAHFCLGHCLHVMDRRRKAVKCYERALALDPNHAVALNNLAVLRMEKAPLRAARDLQAALSADPGFELSKFNIRCVVARYSLYLSLLAMVYFCIMLLAGKKMPQFVGPLAGVVVLAAMAGWLVRGASRLSSGMRMFFKRTIIRNPLTFLSLVLLLGLVAMASSLTVKMGAEARDNFSGIGGFLVMLLLWVRIIDNLILKSRRPSRAKKKGATL